MNPASYYRLARNPAALWVSVCWFRQLRRVLLPVMPCKERQQ